MLQLLEAAGKAIVETGIMGALFVFVTLPLAIFAYRINNKYHTSQKEFLNEIKELTATYAEELQIQSEKRIEEAQDVADKFVKVNNLWRNTVEKQIKELLSLMKKSSKD